jgi:hypothetical protein
MTDAELASFRDALSALEDRVTAFLAEGTDQTAEEIDASVDGYAMPDPLEDRPVSGSDDDSE